MLRRLPHALSLRVVRAVVATTRLVVLVEVLLLARVATTVAQQVPVGTTAPALVVRKPMATHLVLVEAEQQLIRAVAVVDIGVVGARLRHLNLIESQLVATRVAVAGPVSPLPHRYQVWMLERSQLCSTRLGTTLLLVHSPCQYQLVRIQQVLKQLVGVVTTQLVGMLRTSPE
jgi:hypothetical protein